jgi:predicted dehydrogenase
MVAGVFHRAAAAAGLEIAGLHARTPESRARAAAAHGTPTFDTLDALLASGIDALIIATPPNARAEIVAACAQARMPVLAEKPLERTVAAAEALVTGMGDTPFGIVLQHRMRPASRAAKAFLDNGTVGRPRLLRVDVPWWRDPSYYAAPGRGTYARDGGGVLLTQAIHALDLGLWLAGTAVTRVQGATARALHDLEAEDSAAAALTFASGAIGHVTATTAAFPGHPETVELTCDRATLRLTSGRLAVHHRDGRTEHVGEEGGTGSGADPMAFPHDWHQAVLADFAAALREGRPPAIPAAAALPVHRVIDAIARSSAEGRAIDLPPPGAHPDDAGHAVRPVDRPVREGRAATTEGGSP